MTTWAPTDLDTIGATGEIKIAPLRNDGSPRPYTTIWIVRVADDLYVRAYHGPNGRWYRSARRSGQGRIRVNGVEHDVTFEPTTTGSDAVDDAYRRKYGRSSYVDAMITDDAAATTLRLVPR